MPTTELQVKETISAKEETTTIFILNSISYPQSNDSVNLGTAFSQKNKELSLSTIDTGDISSSSSTAQIRINSQDTQQSACIYFVSVGHRYFTAQKHVEASFKAIKGKFGKCIVLVADTLQRYNLAAESLSDFSPEDKKQEAHDKGTLWIKRFQPLAEKIFGKNETGQSNCEFRRWDSYLVNPNYISYRKETENKYINNSIFQKGYDESSGMFLLRREKMANSKGKKAHFIKVKEKLKRFSLEYVKEEGTVWRLLAEEKLPYIGYIQPEELPAFKANRVEYPEFYPFLRWVHIEIKDTPQKNLSPSQLNSKSTLSSPADSRASTPSIPITKSRSPDSPSTSPKKSSPPPEIVKPIIGTVQNSLAMLPYLLLSLDNQQEALLIQNYLSEFFSDLSEQFKPTLNPDSFYTSETLEVIRLTTPNPS